MIELQNIEKVRIDNYSMKMQLYPSKAQKERLDTYFLAVQVAYNMTFHEVFLKNELVCTAPNEKGDVWPDYRKMASAAWRKALCEMNPLVAEPPAGALMNNNGLFLRDAKRAWDTGMGRRPVNPEDRKEFRFYHSNHPRRSFLFQMDARKLVLSEDNPKVAWISVPKIDAPIKARGFNRKLWFGADGSHTLTEALSAGELAKELTVSISKDGCGSYYVSITFSAGKEATRALYLEQIVDSNPVPVGIDVGIKDIAITSTERKIKNRHFKQAKNRSLRRLNRKLSRRWGSANMAFRDYNRELRRENKENPERDPLPLARPSKRYEQTRINKARLERRIARQRDSYYHQQTARLVQESSLIAVETLQVKNMLRNHKLAYALSDAAMSDFLAKLRYKAARRGIPLTPIGMFEPTSQKCSKCGELYPAARNLSVREWVCPCCGAHHDRDINAAKNILAAALNPGLTPADQPPDTIPGPGKPPDKVESGGKRRRVSRQVLLPDQPDIIAVFSKELTHRNDPRYIIIRRSTEEVIDNAQGAGFRSISNARNAYKAKLKRTERLKPDET